MDTIHEIIAAKKELKNYSGTGNDYYNKEEEFTKQLRQYMSRFRSEHLKALTKDELIDLIQICSTHRPCALHSLLLSFSKTSQFY